MTRKCRRSRDKQASRDGARDPPKSAASLPLPREPAFPASLKRCFNVSAHHPPKKSKKFDGHTATRTRPFERLCDKTKNQRSSPLLAPAEIKSTRTSRDADCKRRSNAIKLWSMGANRRPVIFVPILGISSHSDCLLRSSRLLESASEYASASSVLSAFGSVTGAAQGCDSHRRFGKDRKRTPAQDCF
jgi:hypothetical protein